MARGSVFHCMVAMVTRCSGGVVMTPGVTIGDLVLCGCPGVLVSWYSGVVAMVNWRGCSGYQVWLSWSPCMIDMEKWCVLHGHEVWLQW
jgi:hypothetical protein